MLFCWDMFSPGAGGGERRGEPLQPRQDPLRSGKFPHHRGDHKESGTNRKIPHFFPSKIYVDDLNFELPGQFKKNNLPRTPYET